MYAYADIFAATVRFQNQDGFGFLIKTPGVVFFEKSKMSSYGQKWCFGNFSKKIDGYSIIAIRT